MIAGRSFGAVAETYHRYRPGYPDALFDAIVERAPGTAFAVDLGAGTGALTRGLIGRCDRVLAIEPDPAMAALIAPAPNLTVGVQTAEAAPLPMNGVQIFACGTAFHWFDGPKVLGRLHDAAAPGALLCVATYYRPDPGPAAKKIIERELHERWDAYKSDRLGRHDYADRAIAAHPNWSEPEAVRIQNRFVMSADDLAGFYASTSYASAYLGTLDDPSAYLRSLADDLADAAGTDRLEVSLPIETRFSRPAEKGAA